MCNVHFVSWFGTISQMSQPSLYDFKCNQQLIQFISDMASLIYKWPTIPLRTWSHWLFVVRYLQLSSIESEHPYLLCLSITVKLQRHRLRLSVRLLNFRGIFPSLTKYYRIQFIQYYIIDTIDEKKIKNILILRLFIQWKYLMKVVTGLITQGKVSSNNGYKTKSDQFWVHTQCIVLVRICSFCFIEIWNGIPCLHESMNQSVY